MSEESEPDDENVFADILQRLEDQVAECEQEGREVFATACDQLSSRGIEVLRIAYNGYGDSGSVEGFTAYANEKAVELDDELREIIGDAAYNVLPGGWELNEGSYGELVVDVVQRQVTREHNWRVESTEYEEATFNL